MTAVGFAWRSLIRQPARATLAVLGVAAIGALLFDMLMLSQGLVTSMRDLLERTGWDVRVVAAGDDQMAQPLMRDGDALRSRMDALPSVRAVTALRRVPATMLIDENGRGAEFFGAAGTTSPWTILRGRDARSDRELVVDQHLAEDGRAAPGRTVSIQASCLDSRESLPAVDFTIVGVAEFPLQAEWEYAIAGPLAAVERACGGYFAGGINILLVAAASDPAATARDIERALPQVDARTNEDLIGRFQQNGFTYFRQISTVLTTVTVAFALLLIAVLLTVSVNQRLGEIAALRALGFSRRRVVADVLSESALIVGTGGLLSLPLGLLLAQGLDRILTTMPGLPVGLHFFVFQPQALMTHVILLIVTAIAAALYPMQIVARLPIASTLRDEVIG